MKMPKASITLLSILLIYSTANALAAGYSEPALKCTSADPDYFGVLSIENQSSDDPVVKEPAGCSTLKTLVLDSENGCIDVANEIKPDYITTPIPVCSSTVEDFRAQGYDLIGEMIGGRSPPAEGVPCPGEILAVTKFVYAKEEEIDVNVSFVNSGEKACGYEVCIYGRIDESSDDWEKIGDCRAFGNVGPGEIRLAEFTSRSSWLAEALGFLTDILGADWDVGDLNGKFKVELSSNGQVLDLRENAVCLDNVYQLCASKDKKYKYFGEEVPVYGVVYMDQQMPLARKAEDNGNEKYWLLDLEEYVLMNDESCAKEDPATLETKEADFYTVMDIEKYNDYIEKEYSDEPFYKRYADMYGEQTASYMYCYKTDLRATQKCQEYNNFWYGFVRNSLGEFNDYISQEYMDRVKQWNLYQNVTELTYLDEGLEDPAPGYEHDQCTVALDKDYYLPGNPVEIRYGNAPEKCGMSLSGASSGTWEVSGSGSLAASSGSKGRITVSLSCGATCRAEDSAVVELSAVSNVMSDAFMVTPLLEDVRGNSWWTMTGEGSFYGGQGFERYDRCELSCDAKKECHLLSGCTNAQGGTEECSHCDKSKPDYSPPQCTRASDPGECPGSQNDCWERICKVDAKGFTIEAPVGGTDFYGIPYKGSCPEGFSIREFSMQTRAWSPQSGGAMPSKEKKCVMEGGVLGITTFTFSSPEDVDIAFVIDSSSSMDNEWGSLCGIIDTVVAEAQKRGTKITYRIYSLGDKFSSAASGCSNMELLPCEKLNSDLSDVIDCINCEYEGCQKESWAAATAWAAKKHPWKGNAKRIVVPISDEDADCGDDGGGDGWSRIEEAVNAATTAGIQVYSLWGSEGSSPNSFVRKEMEALSKQTNGKAGLFSDQAAMINWFVEMATGSGKEAYAVTNSREVSAKKVQPNVWVYSQSADDVVSTVTVPPALTITETGNMPYSVTKVSLVKEGSNRYRLIRVYVPEDPTKRFTVKADVVLNYSILENAQSFDLDMNTTYVTNVRRDKYYTSCIHYPCHCMCDNIDFNYGLTPPGGLISSCGGISEQVACDCDYDDEGDCIGCDPGKSSYRREIQSEVSTVVYNERDHIYVPGISHRDICGDTLKSLRIEGVFYQEYDQNGALTMYTPPEKPLRITVSPDIVGAFTINVNQSFINYRALLYQAEHDLISMRSSPLPDAQWSNFEERYDYFDDRYVPARCEKKCPGGPVCKASPEDIFSVKCIDLLSQTASMVERTDCAYLASGCYPNPCLSERSYHEEEASFIANGDYEEGKALWAGDGSVEVNGESGHMLKLEGSAFQEIPGLHVKPYSMLCFDYAINEHDKDGVFKVILTLDGKEQEHVVWVYKEDCSDCKGWEKKCIPAKGNLSRLEFRSTVEVYLDNVNIGKYFDYVGLYTYEAENMGYMDYRGPPYDYSGMLSTAGVDHVGNTYQLNVVTQPKKNIETRVHSIVMNVPAVVGELDSGNPVSIVDLLRSEGEEVSPDAYIIKGVEKRWDMVSGKDTYQIHQASADRLEIYAGGQKDTYFTVSDIRGGSLYLSTFFGDLIIPFDKNVEEGKDCYVLDLEFRDPSRIALSSEPSGYSIPRGTEVEVSLKLTKQDGSPLSDERVYIDIEGQDAWEMSPSGLKRDMLFNYNEVSGEDEQQQNLIDYMRYIGQETLADSMEGATYRVEEEGVLNITTSGGGELAVIEARAVGAGRYLVYLKAGCVDELEIGLVDNNDAYSPEYTVFESTENQRRGYLVTAADGSASFSFKPTGITTITASYFGKKASPSSASISLGVIGIRSPLLSGPFIILVLILLFAVFSYRLFKDKRFDLSSWLRDFRGRK